ncbi:MAG: FG-GAP repeat protein, partial [Acidobacteriota bacterium]|nr:FG-GAP repeat protein [Acidobacteriota bacterium]
SLTIALVTGLIWFAPRRPVQPTTDAVTGVPLNERAVSVEQEENRSPQASRPKLDGVAAQKYLEQRGEYQSLIEAVKEIQYGLKRYERSPIKGEGGAGYLAMSHMQNLNAWFNESGVTIRPTVSEEERAKAWQLSFRLKAYGRGEQMLDAPAITSQKVEGSRIEYERAGSGFASSGFGLTTNLYSSEQAASRLFKSQSAIQNPKLVEWYENRPAGIEQGFTVNERPTGASSDKEDGALRLLVALEGGMIGRARDDGRSVELSDKNGKAVLSYGGLEAVDATGRKLQARMEAGGAGDVIALVVDDRDAVYPVVIDPITANLEQQLTAGNKVQANANFGLSVAIDGNTAAVGAPFEDSVLQPSVVFADTGRVYVFTRTNSSWSLYFFPGGTNNGQCGYSVALSGDNFVYGCPGVNNNAGDAFFVNLSSKKSVELGPGFNAGDQFGLSVAVSGYNAVVGAPNFHGIFGVGAGVVLFFQLDPSTLNQTSPFPIEGDNANAHLGTSVAIDSSTVVGGAPTSGYAKVCTTDFFQCKTLRPNAGD